MLTYENLPNGGIIRVRLDGKIIGTINPTGGGWHYRPGGRMKKAGETFGTVALVQASLEN